MQFDADIDVLQTGVWTDFGDAKFKIAHTSSDKFQRALARLQQPHRRKIEQGTMDPIMNRNIVAKAMAEALLLDWKGVTDAEKKEKPYSAEAGTVMLTKNPEFRDFVSDFAMTLDNFRDEEVKELGESSRVG